MEMPLIKDIQVPTEPDQYYRCDKYMEENEDTSSIFSEIEAFKFIIDENQRYYEEDREGWIASGFMIQGYLGMKQEEEIDR